MASYETRGDRVRAIVRTRDGGKKTATFDTRAEAEHWASAHELTKERGGRLVGGGTYTVAEYWPIWRQLRLDPTTNAKDASRYRNHIAPYWGRVRLNAITSTAVDVWVAGMLKGELGRVDDEGTVHPLAPATISAVRALLSGILTGAFADKLIDVHPVHQSSKAKRVKIVTPPSEYRVLEPDEQERVLAELAPHWRPLFEILLRAGIRWGEAAALQVHDIVLDGPDPVIRVRRAMLRDKSVKPFTKTDDHRTVPIGKRVVDILRPLVDGRDPSAFVFTMPATRSSKGGGPLDYWNVRRRVWAPAVKRAKLSGVQPSIHDLRHTCATMLGRRPEIGSQHLRDMFGWRNEHTLNRYLHTELRDRDTVRSIDW